MTSPHLRSTVSTTSPEEYPSERFTPASRTESPRRRAIWRQKLVDAERGLTYSFRSDSSLYLHLFLDCLLLASCGVLGLPATHWAIVGGGVMAMLSAELFSHGLCTVAAELSQRVQKQVFSVCMAAKLVVFLGCGLAIGVILWLRLRELFGG